MFVRKRRRKMTEINVVPYIDVMLVLLIIFMVTAPLIQQGVEVDLPNADAQPVDPSELEAIVVSIDQTGNYYLNIGVDPEVPLSADQVQALVADALEAKPGSPVVVKGDGRVAYEQVVRLMSVLQQAGAPSVGLMTEPE